MPKDQSRDRCMKGRNFLSSYGVHYEYIRLARARKEFGRDEAFYRITHTSRRYKERQKVLRERYGANYELMTLEEWLDVLVAEGTIKQRYDETEDRVRTRKEVFKPDKVTDTFDRFLDSPVYQKEKELLERYNVNVTPLQWCNFVRFYGRTYCMTACYILYKKQGYSNVNDICRVVTDKDFINYIQSNYDDVKHFDDELIQKQREYEEERARMLRAERETNGTIKIDT